MAGFLALLGLFLSAPAVEAATFNPNFIITDRDLEDHAAMSRDQIQEFLLRRGSLGVLLTPDVDGRMKTAADIIWRIAQTYELNPQFLLALMQKEQGIVEGKIPTDAHLAWAAGYAVCDRCDKDHPELQPFAGFANQLESAASRIRKKFLNELDIFGKTFTGWGPGVKKVLRGVSVKPANRATAALYTYTPHIAGNRLLWSLWNKWFQERYPDGSLLESDDPKDLRVWTIQAGKKHRIKGRAVLLSNFDIKKIITVPKEELARYEDGPEFRYPNGSVLEATNGSLYLLRDGLIHKFSSPTVFRKLGFSPDEIMEAGAGDLALWQEGPELTLDAAYPLGTLLQDNATGGVYYVASGLRHPIWSREILRSRFREQPITRAKVGELQTLTGGSPVTFLDGELVGEIGQPTVYVVSEGKLRPIVSAEVFEAMGWRWENVLWTNAKSLSLHEVGAPIFLRTLEATPALAAANSNSLLPTP